MGNPVRLEVELSHPCAKGVDTGDQLAAHTSPGKEIVDKPLLSPKVDPVLKEVESIDKDKGVSVVKVHPLEINGDSFREVKLQDDEKPLLGSGKRVISDEISSASSGVEMSILPPPSEGEISPELLRDIEAKSAPYVRRDKYGNFGKAEISVGERCLLGLAVVTIVPIRLVLTLLMLITYYLICKACTIYRRPGEEEGQENFSHLTGLRRVVIVRAGKFLSRSLLFVLGFYHIKVTEKGPDLMHQLQLGVAKQTNEDSTSLLDSTRNNPGVIVSNHISYIDILYHISASFPSFVAKRSVAKLPLVGLISKCMGCLYVQRESKSSNSKGVSGIVVDRARAAHDNPIASVLLLFPEGTTTNGEYLLPFRTGAFLAETPVQPVILKYPYKRFSPAWETMTGVRHILLLLCQFVNNLEVVRLPVYYPTNKECSDPKTYANNVRLLMSTEGNLALSEIGLYEKRVYHAALAGKPLPIKAREKLD